nr:hypothetical protein HAHEADPM_00006 [uncultured Methanosarcinales archaeon]
MVVLSPAALAYEEDDIIIYPGIEAEDLVTFCSSILASALFVVTIVAYKRDKRKRLLYVSIAFFLFAVKGFLSTAEMFFPQAGWTDLIASLLDFAILLSFFVGLLKK